MLHTTVLTTIGDHSPIIDDGSSVMYYPSPMMGDRWPVADHRVESEGGGGSDFGRVAVTRCSARYPFKDFQGKECWVKIFGGKLGKV
jgi:hypothetical protein